MFVVRCLSVLSDFVFFGPFSVVPVRFSCTFLPFLILVFFLLRVFFSFSCFVFCGLFFICTFLFLPFLCLLTWSLYLFFRSRRRWQLFSVKTMEEKAELLKRFTAKSHSKEVGIESNINQGKIKKIERKPKTRQRFIFTCKPRVTLENRSSKKLQGGTK